jgi:predicted nucleic acid-binding protein
MYRRKPLQIVVDTSAIIAVIMNEASKPEIINATIDATLVAPGSLPWEIGNALSSLFKRRRINLEQALAALRAYQKISLRLVDVDLEVAVRFAEEMNIYAYDAYILACATILKAPILALDGSMLKLAQAKGIKIVEVRRNA